MPSGPKKRAKAKKKQHQHLGLYDEPDNLSRSSDDKETDTTADSVDDQEDDLALKSPLGKSAYTRIGDDEDHKSQTEKWVRVSNFEVGLPTPRSEGSATDYDNVIEDENNGTRSPDWETVESESTVFVGSSPPEVDKREAVAAVDHGVKPEELEAVLQCAEKDYFSPERAESSKDVNDDASAAESLVVERGTDVADYSVGSSTLPYDGCSLNDSSEDQGDFSTQGVPDIIVADSKSAVGAVPLSDDDSAQAGDVSSALLDSDDQDFHHAQGDHSDDQQFDQPPQLSAVGAEAKGEDDGTSRTHVDVLMAGTDVEIEGQANEISTIAVQDVSSPSEFRDALRESVIDDTEAEQEALNQVGDEHDGTRSPSIQENAVTEAEEGHSYEEAEWPALQDAGKSQTAEVADSAEEDGSPSLSSQDIPIAILNDHEETGSLTPKSSAVSFSETSPTGLSVDKSRTANDAEFPRVEVPGANGHNADGLPAPTYDKAPLKIFSADNSATVLSLTKIEVLQAADGTSLGAVASVYPSAVSELQPNERVLVIDEAKDARDRSSSGCCGVFYWMFGRADY